MRFAFADPPYLGCCGLYEHYHGDALELGCWDEPETHRDLVDYLVRGYPHGWALSCSTPSLRTILPMCPEDVRVAAWCKSFGAFKKGVRPAYMWEPVIFWRGRNPTAGHPHAPPDKGGQQTTPKDFLVEPITLKRGLTGAKPEQFCEWVLSLLGYRDEDELVDVFPGTGVMGRVLAQGRMAI